jgi:hypothetical protein
VSRTGEVAIADVKNPGNLAVATLALACALLACGGRSERIEGRGGDDRGGNGGSATVCGVTGGRANGGFELTFTQWKDRISIFVERDDGALLAYRPYDFLRVERDGAITALDIAPPLRSALERSQSIGLSPRGQTLLLIQDWRDVFLFDGDGAEVRSSFSAPDGQNVLDTDFSDSGELVVVEYGEIGLERTFPMVLEVRHIDGRVISSTPPRRERALLPASDDQMIWRPSLEQTELSVTDLAQKELYRVDLGSGVGHLRASSDGKALILQLNANEVVHVENGVALPPYLPDAAVSDVRMSPRGHWSAFVHAFSGRVHLFEAGAWRTGTVLPFERIDSFDVSDRGDVVVGGRDAAGAPQLFLLDSDLSVEFSCAGSHLGDYGMSTRFSRDGERVLALLEDRLSVFSVR